eukprot:GCRY01002937.1.p1 GENE.GCRY01002937.1~~GCRY01002937.1.p1  ORF type:complete len:147 (-),score=23.19 GCRY01002937.1:465-905(-)
MSQKKDNYLEISEDAKESKFLVQALNSSSKVQPKPNIVPVERSSLFSRLDSFLPSLKKANKDLENEISSNPSKSFSIEDVSEGEQYIQMDLALGVLTGVDKSESAEAETEAEPIVPSLSPSKGKKRKAPTELIKEVSSPAAMDTSS